VLFYPLLLLGSVIFLDICLSGDNAVVVAMAANGVKKELRDAAIFLGMGLAAVLRILLALIATTLLNNHWIAFIGGLLLLWVAYNLGKDLFAKAQDDGKEMPNRSHTMWSALLTIVAADISMSLDNILAIAGLARNHGIIMAIGILASIFILVFVARHVATLLEKHKWLNWVGLVLIIYVAFDLISGSYDSTIVIMRS
jgi:YjbE family integral membrane protein